MSLKEMSLPAQHGSKNQGLQKSSVRSLGRSMIRPRKSGGNRVSGVNKAGLRSRTSGRNIFGHKPDVLEWAKMLSVHLCF